MPKRNRTLAREISLQALFQQDLTDSKKEDLDDLLSEAAEEERGYARSLVTVSYTHLTLPTNREV